MVNAVTITQRQGTKLLVCFHLPERPANNFGSVIPKELCHAQGSGIEVLAPIYFFLDGADQNVWLSRFYEKVIDLPSYRVQRCLKCWITRQEKIQAVGLGTPHGAGDSETASRFT